MKEIIEDIYENDDISSYKETAYGGYIVKTNKRKIKVLISSGQSCCEISGYAISNENPKDYIGSELFEVVLCDNQMKNTIFDETFKELSPETNAIFVTFKTSNGDFQLTVYNSHNGFYGHRILITDDININESDIL